MASVYGLHEMGRKKRKNQRVKRGKAPPRNPESQYKKYNKRVSKSGEVRRIDPAEYKAKEVQATEPTLADSLAIIEKSKKLPF